MYYHNGKLWFYVNLSPLDNLLVLYDLYLFLLYFLLFIAKKYVVTFPFFLD